MAKAHLKAVLFIILAIGCGRSGAVIYDLPGDAVILAFGDSLTYGTGAKPYQSYPSVLENITGYKVINAGVPGEVTGEGLQRLPDLLEIHEPHLVILCHGGNDLLRRFSDEKISSNLEAMIRMIKEREIKVILMGVPNPGIMVKTAPIYYNISKSEGIPSDLETMGEVLSTRSFKSDQIHPNAEGYKKIAEAIARLLPKK